MSTNVSEEHAVSNFRKGRYSGIRRLVSRQVPRLRRNRLPSLQNRIWVHRQQVSPECWYLSVKYMAPKLTTFSSLYLFWGISFSKRVIMGPTYTSCYSSGMFTFISTRYNGDYASERRTWFHNRFRRQMSRKPQPSGNSPHRQQRYDTISNVDACLQQMRNKINTLNVWTLLILRCLRNGKEMLFFSASAVKSP
jgi:hypothetical protein